MESPVIVWEDTDFREYHRKRLQTDSLFTNIESVSCGTFVLPSRPTPYVIYWKLRRYICSALWRPLPDRGSGQPARKSSAYCYQGSGSYPDSHPKKKGIAGWFGGKRSVQVFEPSKGLQDLNEKLIAMQEERERRMDMYTDSLRIQNKALNQKLQILITHLDGQAQAAFISREEKITEAGDFLSNCLSW